MSIVWAIIVSAIMVLIVYASVSSKMQAKRRRAAREKLLPYLQESIQPGQCYTIHLSDGRMYRNVELLGTNDPQAEQFALGGWESLLVLRQASGKRLFIRQAAIRCLEEQ